MTKNLAPTITDDDVQAALAGFGLADQKDKSGKYAKERSGLLDILGHKHRAKAFLKTLSVDTLDFLAETAMEVAGNIRQEITEKSDKIAEVQSLIEQIQAKALDVGLPIEVITQLISTPKPKTYKKRQTNASELTIETANKLQVMRYKAEIFGREYFWSGCTPKTPKPFKAHLAKGHSKESMLLPEAEWFVKTGRSDYNIPDEYLASAKTLLARFEREIASK